MDKLSITASAAAIDKELTKQVRAAAKSAREVEKAKKQLDKVNTQLVRAKQALARHELAEARRRTARCYFPDSFPNWLESDGKEPALTIKNFYNVRNESLHEEISSALRANSVGKIFDALSKALDCDKTEICLIEHHFENEVYFRYTFNPLFNDILKLSEQASFSTKLKAWRVTLSDGSKEFISKYIGAFYRVVIDLSSMTIMLNNAETCIPPQTRIAFAELPFHVQVDKSAVISAILKNRPSEFVDGDAIYINDGVKFVLFPDANTLWTQLPFLLIRYSVVSGPPRYASFSTIGMSVEHVTFSGDKRTFSAMARFMDACRILKKNAFEQNNQSIIECTPLSKNKLHGNFERFSESIQVFQSKIPDLGFAPLCSDYATLLATNFGADSNLNGIIAYVSPRLGKDNYIFDIACFFGYKPADYPIVFSRSSLDEWAKSDSHEFKCTVAHELAHWLVLENSDEFKREYFDHGIAWSICYDLLRHLVLGGGEYTSVYRNYQPDDQKTIYEIEEVVANTGFPSLDRSIKSTQALSKSDIKNTTLECLAKISSFQQIA